MILGEPKLAAVSRERENIASPGCGACAAGGLAPSRLYKVRPDFGLVMATRRRPDGGRRAEPRPRAPRDVLRASVQTVEAHRTAGQDTVLSSRRGAFEALAHHVGR